MEAIEWIGVKEMQRRKDNIEYLELTEHELAQYRQHGRKSMCIRVIFFSLLIPIYFLCCIEIFSKLPVPFVWCLITLLVYVTAFLVAGYSALPGCLVEFVMEEFPRKFTYGGNIVDTNLIFTLKIFIKV